MQATASGDVKAPSCVGDARFREMLASVEDVRTFSPKKRGLNRLRPALRRKVQEMMKTLAEPEYAEMIVDLRDLMTEMEDRKAA